MKVTNVALEANRKKIFETAGYYSAHVALVGLGIIECMLATEHGLLATILAACVFIIAACYDAVVGNSRQGWTAATLSYAFGLLVNWLWRVCWPQDFEGMKIMIPFAILFAIIGFSLQMLMIWDDHTD